MYERLKRSGRAVSDRYAGRPGYFELTPAAWSLLKALKPWLDEIPPGRILDAGAGRGPFRELLRNRGRYIGVDIAPGGVADLLGDVQSLPFGDGSFETVFCSQVLEHVPDPARALSEFRRVLKPGGRLILSVPHICWLHNEPHDYFRFTPHSLRLLLGKAGLRVEHVGAAGGLLCLLGHIASSALVQGTFAIPVVGRLFFQINRLLVRTVAFWDERIERRKLFALNLVCVARAEG